MLPRRPHGNYIAAYACDVLLCSKVALHQAVCHVSWHVHALHACSNQSLPCVRMKRGKLAGSSPKEIGADWARKL